MFSINFFKIMKIVRAFKVSTFVNDKVLSTLDRFQCSGAVRATKGSGFCESIFVKVEFSVTNLTPDLSFRTIVFVKINLWSVATRAGAIVRDVAV